MSSINYHFNNLFLNNNNILKPANSKEAKEEKAPEAETKKDENNKQDNNKKPDDNKKQTMLPSNSDITTWVITQRIQILNKPTTKELQEAVFEGKERFRAQTNEYNKGNDIIPFKKNLMTELFKGKDKIDASTFFYSLSSMLSSSIPEVQQLANLINNEFLKYGIDNRNDLKKLFIQEFFVKINQLGSTNSIENYKLNHDNFKKLYESGNIISILNNLMETFDFNQIKNSYFDSSIGSFAQNGDGGCWMYAGLKALSSTTTGQELIRNAINWNADRSAVTIKFQGVNKSYTISLSALIDNRMDYALGDLEAAAFGMATEMLRRDIKNGFVHITDARDFNHVNTEDSGKPGEGLYGGNTDQFFYFLTGKKEDPTGAGRGNDRVDISAYGKTFLQHLITDGFNHYTSTFTLSNENLYNFYKKHNVNNYTEEQLLPLKQSGHAFAITGITNNTVIISDPASTIPIEISWDEFCNLGIDYVSELYMYGNQIAN